MLKEEFSLHNCMFFRYLQVRHAAKVQFSSTPLQPTPHPIMATAKITDPRGLISTFYNMLSTPTSTKLAFDLKPRWEREVGPLENEEREETLESCKAVSPPRLSDRLSQIYITHRAYLTPIWVARYKRNQSTLCLLCGQETGTFFPPTLDLSKSPGVLATNRNLPAWRHGFSHSTWPKTMSTRDISRYCRQIH